MIRRNFLRNAAAGSSLLLARSACLGAVPSDPVPAACGSASPSVASRGEPAPDALFQKPAPVTIREWARRDVKGVAAIEVSDYAPGGYQGALSPSPPHADINAKRAVIVSWERAKHRLVFCHEASYDPWMELPSGVALCNQFFEGNNGWAELFNNNGRRERNSFVDVVQSGPERVWVRWNYFCVNKDDDSRPALRGTEDYITHANGLVWRRLTYSTLMAGRPEGYSWQPIDFFAVAPSGTTWSDLFERDDQVGDYHVASAIAAASDLRYDIYWADGREPRRKGDKQVLLDIAHSSGFAMVIPFKAGCLFTIMGTASGFPAEKSQIVDHSFTDTGGWGWGARRWDHWPIGWVNAQAHEYKPGSPYPYHFGPFSHYIVNKPIEDARRDYPIEARDMDLNRWSERHVYYTLTGVGRDLESIRRLAAQWLGKGHACANPQSVANLSWPL
jgi:hypothetical protein